MDRHPVGSPTATMSPAAPLSVVELWSDPGQTPLQVGEHELERLGPLLLRVELGFDGVRPTATSRVFDFALLNVHPGGQRVVEVMTANLVRVHATQNVWTLRQPFDLKVKQVKVMGWRRRKTGHSKVKLQVPLWELRRPVCVCQHFSMGTMTL